LDGKLVDWLVLGLPDFSIQGSSITLRDHDPSPWSDGIFLLEIGFNPIFAVIGIYFGRCLVSTPVALVCSRFYNAALLPDYQ